MSDVAKQQARCNKEAESGGDKPQRRETRSRKATRKDNDDPEEQRAIAGGGDDRDEVAEIEAPAGRDRRPEGYKPDDREPPAKTMARSKRSLWRSPKLRRCEGKESRLARARG